MSRVVAAAIREVNQSMLERAREEIALRNENSDNAEGPPASETSDNTVTLTTGAICRPEALVEINAEAIRNSEDETHLVAIRSSTMLPSMRDRYTARLDASVALSDSGMSIREELNALKAEIAELKKQIVLADECDAAPDHNKRKLQL